MPAPEKEEVASRLFRELLDPVVGRDDVAELRTVINLLKHLDEVPVGHHREILGILQSFRALPPSAQDRLLSVLSEALDGRGDKE